VNRKVSGRLETHGGGPSPPRPNSCTFCPPIPPQIYLRIFSHSLIGRLAVSHPLSFACPSKRQPETSPAKQGSYRKRPGRSESRKRFTRVYTSPADICLQLQRYASFTCNAYQVVRVFVPQDGQSQSRHDFECVQRSFFFFFLRHHPKKK
jgi:hypothetical protein